MLVWLATKIFDFLSGDILNKALDVWNKKQDIKIRQGEIDADVKKDLVNQYVNFHTVEAARLTALSTKWQYWLLASPFIIALALYFIGLTAYNLLWCADCIYPQPWTIAAFPSPYDQWCMAMISFLFGTTTLAALFKR